MTLSRECTVRYPA